MAMAGATEGFAALGEAVVFLNHFKDLPDPRQPGKVVYPLEEVLLLCLLAILGGAETVVDIALFGERKLEFLRRFRRFRDGTRMTSLATFLPRSTPPSFSSASSPGWRR
jgi:hypothetical protein